MDRKSVIRISGMICLAVMAVVIGVCYYMGSEEESIQSAENCSQIKLFIEFSSGTERINSWQNEKGEYLFSFRQAPQIVR